MKRKMKRRDLLTTVPLVAAAIATSAGAAESGAKSPAATVSEPARRIPVVHECDLCVIGGSCTGVFAAVAAARLGAKVALIESNGFFGGVATASLVNIWHSLADLKRKNVLVAGRCLDADEGAFGAVRVMVNCNQMGQAAGAAAWLALDSSKDVDKLDTAKLRATLKKQGAVVI